MLMKQSLQAHSKLITYIVLSLALILGIFVLQPISWQTTARTHTIFESIATFLALFVGVIALVRYYSQKNFIFLLVGTGYLGAALLNSYHTFVTSTTFPISYPTTLPSLIPWSGMASQLFLAILLGVSWLFWPKWKTFEATDRITEVSTFSVVSVLTLASFLFFAFVPLPRQIYYPGQLIPRPWEVIPTLFFLMAVVGVFRQGYKRESSFMYWLVVALIINAFLHFPYLAISSQLFDVMFNVSHILKILAHATVIIGLWISTYHLFKQAEDSNRQLQIEITERKRAEETVREREQQFRLLFELAPIGMAITSLEGIFRRVNQAFCNTTGYSSSELLSKSFIDITHPDDRANNLVSFNQLKQEQISSYQVEKRYIHKSGQIVHVILQVGLVRDAGGKPDYIISQVVDITDRKRSELALAEARDQALEASRLKTELLAKVSHELRTPLGAILGFAEIMELGIYGPVTDQQKEILAEIVDSTQYQTGLVNELLDQAQLDAGRLKLNIVPFTLTEIIDGVMPKMNVFAQAKGLSLVTDVATDMPATLSCDPDRLQQILLNLVSNAIKFTKKGAVTLRFSRNGSTYWTIEISDTGPGIPVEAQSHIFEPFGQVDGSITREHGGTGLGLSIVKQLTTLMGGRITLESEVGKGSTFTILLPLQPTTEERDLALPETASEKNL